MKLGREDRDVLYLALSTGGGVTLATWMRLGTWPEALAVGGMAACGVGVCVYGSTVLARGLPDTARSWIEFRSVLAGPPALSAGEGDQDATEDEVEEDTSLEERWRVALRRFLLAGRMRQSFSIRDLACDKVEGGKVRRKFVTDTGYRAFMQVLKEAGVMVTGNGGTDYAPGFDYGRAVFCVKHEPLPRPGKEPPTVMW